MTAVSGPDAKALDKVPSLAERGIEALPIGSCGEHCPRYRSDQLSISRRLAHPVNRQSRWGEPRGTAIVGQVSLAMEIFQCPSMRGSSSNSSGAARLRLKADRRRNCGLPVPPRVRVPQSVSAYVRRDFTRDLDHAIDMEFIAQNHVPDAQPLHRIPDQ